MAFAHNLPEAARRHLQAADMLYEGPGHRKDVAGYLYGIAAECAIKQMVVAVQLPSQSDKNAIFYAHFPELRTMLRDALGARRLVPLTAFILSDAFMNNWDIKMRYADARQINDAWVSAWRQQAKDVVSAMGT